jgi:hypothetical protein
MVEKPFKPLDHDKMEEGVLEDATGAPCTRPLTRVPDGIAVHPSCILLLILDLQICRHCAISMPKPVIYSCASVVCAGFENAPDGSCHPNPNAWMTYVSNFSRCVGRTTNSMADGALACVCRNHQPFSGPFDPVCTWLDRFSRNCDQCTTNGRRLQYSLLVQKLPEDGSAVRSRQLQSLVGGLPPNSPCKDYDPERVCAAAPETRSDATLYGRYTMCSWFTCREDWKQRLRSGTSTELRDAVCGCL